MFADNIALRHHILASHKGTTIPIVRNRISLQSALEVQAVQQTQHAQLTQEIQRTQALESTQDIQQNRNIQPTQEHADLDDIVFEFSDEQPRETAPPANSEVPVVNLTNDQPIFQSNSKEFREEKVGGDIWNEAATSDCRARAVDVPDIDLMLAELALDCNISNDNYRRLVDIVMLAQQAAINSPLEALVWYTTMESVFKNIKKNQEPHVTLPFTVEQINLNDIPELANHKERLTAIIGKPVLIYRDIRHLSEKLLSHPIFEEVTHIQPSILRDSDGDRVYEDLFSGDWWINMQKSQCSGGSMVLGLMLASDKTVITGNHRESAWPLYLKLANTPAKYRDKDTLHGNRLLAYFPVIESKTYGKKEWFRRAKMAIFHHCLSRILAPFKGESSYILQGPKGKLYNCIPALASYSADMPEQ
ncbi:hypothetical protein BJV82DRAFT_664063 [Fennellomyces sp. T-0311]|nr:hypothetical protein BJV82DRAFT_664063 [Fennellomyces sp. T-0311]